MRLNPREGRLLIAWSLVALAFLILFLLLGSDGRFGMWSG